MPEEKNKKFQQLSSMFNDVNSPEEFDSDIINGPPQTIDDDVRGHDVHRAHFTDLLMEVSSPDDIIEFQQALREIGYTVVPNNDGSFKVLNKDNVEVLKGDKVTCQMSSPLDKEVLKVYLNAHNDQGIIVDKCKTKAAAIQLIDACNANKPRVPIKFPAGMLDHLGFDAYDYSKHPVSKNEPKLPDIAIKYSGIKRPS